MAISGAFCTLGLPTIARSHVPGRVPARHGYRPANLGRNLARHRTIVRSDRDHPARLGHSPAVPGRNRARHGTIVQSDLDLAGTATPGQHPVPSHRRDAMFPVVSAHHEGGTHGHVVDFCFLDGPG